MDGVLALSEPVHYQAWLMTIDELGLDYFLPEKEIIGVTDNSIARMIIESSAIAETEDRLLLLKRKHFLTLMKEGAPAVDGRDEFLNRYSKTAQLAVVSSSGREEIEMTLSACGIRDFFRFFLGFEDTRFHKPHAEPYLKALQLTGCLPEETLIIEDSPSGVEAALKTGAFVAGLNSSNLLDNASNAPLFTSFSAISRWLEQDLK